LQLSKLLKKNEFMEAIEEERARKKEQTKQQLVEVMVRQNEAVLLKKQQ